jgi:hypothetical protein
MLSERTHSLAIRTRDGDVQGVGWGLLDLPVAAIHIVHGYPGVVAIGSSHLDQRDGCLPTGLLHKQSKPTSRPIVIVCKNHGEQTFYILCGES